MEMAGQAATAGRNSPWPVTSGPLLLREATEADIETMLSFRIDEQVNWFMLQTEVDSDAFRLHWLAVPGSNTDFSCVAEVAGQVVAIGFLEVVSGMGQPGMPEGSEGMIGYIVDPRYAGRGYATHLAKGLLSAAFGHLGLRRLSAGCFADNRLFRGQPGLGPGPREGRDATRATRQAGLVARPTRLDRRVHLRPARE